MISQTIAAYDLLDNAMVTGETVKEALIDLGEQNISVETIKGKTRSTDFIRILVPGSEGKRSGGKAPTLGIIGRLGGIGIRPRLPGLVSDSEGAIVSVTCAMKLADMIRKGDRLTGDVIISTHFCSNASTKLNNGVEFMEAPLDSCTMSLVERITEADAVVSIDTTKGNRIINHLGFAITPTVKEGYILPVSKDLVTIMQVVTGKPAVVMPISIPDITPYGNGLPHINSIMQPATVTDAPVAGVAITTEEVVPGSATGSTHIVELEKAARFVIEVAKLFGKEEIEFYDSNEYSVLLKLYGSMKRFQTK